jgi:acetyl-CoA C-acetyltransferase
VVSSLDPRTPVLVGVGTALGDVEAVELMVRATAAAGDDAGGTGLLSAVQQIAVPRGTWSYTDPARIIAERIGATGAHTVLAKLGIPQQTLINDALAGIMAGEIDVALVVGGEARARAARAAKASMAADAAGISRVFSGNAGTEDGASEIDQHGAEPDVVLEPTGTIVSQAEIEAGLFAPVEQYALIESALRAAEQRTLPDHRREVAELWCRFNGVARHNPEAAFPSPRGIDDLVELGAGNRPLAFPYGKWHASQWTVDQGAALLLCSIDAARRFGVPNDRWVHPLVGLDSSFELPLSNRRHLHRWPAMQVLGAAAADRIGSPLAACDHAEVYSCFPAAVRVQQRELGLPLDGTPTITGGMTFAGGPFNSFVLHATAAMARLIRREGGTGLVTTVSGLLTKPGLGIWSGEPDSEPPLLADLGDAGRRATESIDVVPPRDAAVTVAACTVTYTAEQPTEVIAIVDATDAERMIGRSRDPALARRATEEELVGQALVIDGDGTLHETRRAAPPGSRGR